MHNRCLFVLSALLFCSPLLAAEPETGPIIDGYGAAYLVPDADVPLLPDHVYRVAWEITEYANQPDGVNRRLERVARFLNLHARHGVPKENMHMGVVVHGTALMNMLSDAAYQARFGRTNPNLDLVEKLAAAGVEFFVCGQSMAGRGFAKSELAEPVKLATSALTMVHQLQYEGYTLQP
ncbi:MAG: DsrE family protein [Gammaproteobacteria bacterium]|jgi:intracellular sulfur oxidation DsrE/DsrF family protein